MHKWPPIRGSRGELPLRADRFFRQCQRQFEIQALFSVSLRALDRCQTPRLWTPTCSNAFWMSSPRPCQRRKAGARGSSGPPPRSPRPAGCIGITSRPSSGTAIPQPATPSNGSGGGARPIGSGTSSPPPKKPSPPAAAPPSKPSSPHPTKLLPAAPFGKDLSDSL